VSLFSAAFYGCAELGRLLSVPAFPYVSFWLPAGLCVGVLLLNETCAWPWFILAAAPANFLFDHWSGTPFATTVGFYVANMLEAVTGAWLARRWVAPKPSLATLREFLGLLGCAAVIGSMLGAVVGAATLTASGMSQSFWRSWLTWWGNEAMFTASCNHTTVRSWPIANPARARLSSFISRRGQSPESTPPPHLAPLPAEAAVSTYWWWMMNPR
jgi:integral membrane sensor domain MASE1